MNRDAKVTAYYSLIIKRSRLILRKIQGYEVKQEEIDSVESDMFELFPPMKFFGVDGKEIQSTKDFEETCFNLSTHINKDPKNLTVLEYYQAIESIMEKNKNSGK